MTPTNPFMLDIAMGIRGVTVEELAEQSGVSADFIRAYLDGQSPLFGERDMIAKWATILHFPPAHFYRAGERPDHPPFMC